MTYVATISVTSPVAGDYTYPLESIDLDRLMHRIVGAVMGIAESGAAVSGLVITEVES